MSRLDLRALALSDAGHFSRLVLGVPLYDYQLAPLRAVLESIFAAQGREFLLLFSRQSGKNEAIAHLLVYLLNLRRAVGASIVYAATGDGLGRGLQRLEARLNNPLNAGEWRKGGQPPRRSLGRASVLFLSSHPGAAARGATADPLLVIDELQDQQRAHLEAVFTPMRAARNATAVYLGTARTRHDALWLKKEELERLSAADGVPRVFWARPPEVTAANPAYGRFLDEQVRRYGREHPIVASEYYLQPLEGQGGLFPPRRLALMRGRHGRLRAPRPGVPVIALLDVGGQDEAATHALARLDNPARDYTACTIVQVGEAAGGAGPAYAAVDVFVDQGSRHFESVPGRPSLAERLLAYLQHWDAAHLVGDATGVGEGLCGWLAARLGAGRVTAFKFSGPAKAALGAGFLALVETGRFTYWGDDAEQEGSDGWWFWTQAAHCAFELPAGGRFERDLRWGVPAAARVATAAGRLPVHDDRLISAALVAEADRLLRAGRLSLGGGRSVVVPGTDPLAGLGNTE